jgi:hypothetical protein
MLTAAFDVSGFERVKTKMLSTMLEKIERAVVHAGNDAVEIAKQGAFKDHTGDLRREIVFRNPHWSGTWFMGILHAQKPYASFVNDGTSPHTIYPKAPYGAPGPLPKGQSRRASGKGPHEHIVGRGYALRWKDAGGTEHFARVVHHPGTQPIPFMNFAAEVARDRLFTELKAGWSSITFN